MDLLTVITILFVISASFSYINERFIKLPGTIGVVTISVFVSIFILIIGKTSASTKTIVLLANSIDFSDVLLDVLLGFLLFASALHFDYKKLKEERWPVFVLSTVGVAISTAVFGGLLYAVTQIIEVNISLLYCFIFGALISPTDPIAVGAILKNSNILPKLNTVISGESLFNDAVGLLLFVTLLGISHQPDAAISGSKLLHLFVQEVMGGIIIGCAIGFVGYKMIKSIRDYQSILLISIALVFALSFFAQQFHASIPLAAVSAGLIVGNNNLDERHVSSKFLASVWQLIDDVLNTILFVMIGLQLVIMPFLNNYWIVGTCAIVIILIARLLSISVPAFFLVKNFSFNNLTILTWAGLRGGISLAMALSLPNSPYREVILASCYFIVIFSIIIQGLTLNKVVAKMTAKKS